MKAGDLGESLQLPAEVWSGVGQAAVGIPGEFVACSPDQAQQPMASLSKLILAVTLTRQWHATEKYSSPEQEENQPDISFEMLPEDFSLTQKYRSLGARVLNLQPGARVSRRQALEAMLVCSASDVADMLVRKVFTDEETYVANAQSMLHDMGLSKTVVADASGFNTNSIGTPEELLVVGAHALQEIPSIAQMAVKPRIEVPGMGYMDNKSPFLGQPLEREIFTVKGAYLRAAGRCSIVASPDKTGQGKPIIGVIMGSDTEHLVPDAVRMVEWAAGLTP